MHLLRKQQSKDDRAEGKPTAEFVSFLPDLEKGCLSDAVLFLTKSLKIMNCLQYKKSFNFSHMETDQGSNEKVSGTLYKKIWTTHDIIMLSS